MGCCNEKRRGLTVATVRVEYRGTKTNLRLFGGATGRTYEFHGNGDAMAIDPRDLPYITNIPGIVVLSQ
jgi:hypothetical protein